MLRISAYYPASPDVPFDVDYYINEHVPLSRRLFGEFGAQRIEVDRGVEGPAPGQAPMYAAVGHIFIESLDDFRKALEVHGAQLGADLAKCTTMQPLVQVSEIVG